LATILIVDDHPAFRLVIKTHLLQMPGIDLVVEADNGQAAVELARQHTPSLVVLDLDIPRINGLDVIPRLKLIDPESRVLILSGQDPTTFVPRAMRAGAHAFVGKAQDLREFTRAVEAVMAGYTVFPLTRGVAGTLVENASDEAHKLAQLSDKELVILQMLARGMSNQAIGEALFISNKTVSSHKTRVMKKLMVDSLVELVDFARRCRITAGH
jgi:two-component system, NarL family, response regulator EvgA